MPENRPDPAADDFDFEFDFGDADGFETPSPKPASEPSDDGDAVIRKRAGTASAKVVTPAKQKRRTIVEPAPGSDGGEPVSRQPDPAPRARTTEGEVVVRSARSTAKPKPAPAPSEAALEEPPAPRDAAPQAAPKAVPESSKAPAAKAKLPSPRPANPGSEPPRSTKRAGDSVSVGNSELPPPKSEHHFRPVPDPFAVAAKTEHEPHELDVALADGAVGRTVLPEPRESAPVVERERRSLNWPQGGGGFGGRKKLIVSIAAVAVLGVLAFFLIKGLGGSGGEEGDGGGGAAETPPSPAPGGGEAGKPIVPRTGESLADIKFRIDDSLEKFFAATKPSGLLAFVRDPQRVKPLMENYYARHRFQQPVLERVGRVEEIMINLKTFWTAEVGLAEGVARTVVLQDTDEGFVVDWETFVSYNPMDWDDFAEGEKGGRMQFRVYATLDHKPGYAFPEPAGWVCVQLSSRGSDSVLYGYAPKGSDVALKLEEMLTNEWEYPCILELEFPEDPKGGDDQVHIRRLVIEHWIMVD